MEYFSIIDVSFTEYCVRVYEEDPEEFKAFLKKRYKEVQLVHKLLEPTEEELRQQERESWLFQR